MENKNTIELNVVRLGGNNNGKVPTKLSELNNDCDFVARQTFAKGSYTTTGGVYLNDENTPFPAKVLTKRKGEAIKIFRLKADPNWGSESKNKDIQLVFNDLNGNEILRFPSEDAILNEGATLAGLSISDIASDILFNDEAGRRNFHYTDKLPEEFEMYLLKITSGANFIAWDLTMDGYISLDEVLNKKQDSTTLGTAAFKSVEEIVQLVKQSLNS